MYNQPNVTEVSVMLEPPSPISGRKIRIALVGCGRISFNHIRVMLHHERANLLLFVMYVDV